MFQVPFNPALIAALAGAAMAQRHNQQQQQQQQMQMPMQAPQGAPVATNSPPSDNPQDAILRVLSGDTAPDLSLMTDEQKRAALNSIGEQNNDDNSATDMDEYGQPTVRDLVMKKMKSDFGGTWGQLRYRNMMTNPKMQSYFGESNSGTSPFSAENRRGSILRFR